MAQVERLWRTRGATNLQHLDGQLVRTRLPTGALRSLLNGTLCLALILTMLAPTPARADLALCNATSSRVGVSIGYQDSKGWVTEGWWTIGSQSCETLLKGALPSQFLYVHAVDYDRGGEWVGSNFMCTAAKSFAIRGVQNCGKRGYKRTGFYEIDTGKAQEWTIRLSDPDSKGQKGE